jgi:hypothetical protein
MDPRRKRTRPPAENFRKTNPENGMAQGVARIGALWRVCQESEEKIKNE